MVYDPVRWIVSYLRDIGDAIYNDTSTIVTLENLKNDLYYEDVQKLQIEAKRFLYNIGGNSDAYLSILVSSSNVLMQVIDN